MKNYQKIKQQKRKRRIIKTRSKIYGTENRPRLSVYRSLKHIYAQLIDDQSGRTFAAANDQEIKKDTKKGKDNTKTELAKEVGKLIAKKSIEKGIEKVVFDRRGYKYHGRVKALAEGAREGGLKF